MKFKICIILLFSIIINCFHRKQREVRTIFSPDILVNKLYNYNIMEAAAVKLEFPEEYTLEQSNKKIIRNNFIGKSQ